MIPKSVEKTLRDAAEMRRLFENHFITIPSYTECVKYEETIDRLIGLVAKSFLPPPETEPPKFEIPIEPD